MVENEDSKKRRRRRRRPTLIWADLKTTIQISKWSYPHHSHVSTMWLEIIETVRSPDFGEQNNQHLPLKTLETCLPRLWWTSTKKGVFTFFQVLLSCLINRFNFLSWHLQWTGKTQGIPLPFLPRGWGLINVTTLSGPAEYIYLVLGEWWPTEKECA